MAKTKIPDNRDPTNAPPVILVIPSVEIPPKTITATAPQDAPDEIPNMYGSAIGFFVTHCISTPQIARPAPQIAPSITLGNLISLSQVLKFLLKL